MPGRSVTLAKDVVRLVRATRYKMHNSNPEKYPDPEQISYNDVIRWLCCR